MSLAFWAKNGSELMSLIAVYSERPEHPEQHVDADGAEHGVEVDDAAA